MIQQPIFLAGRIFCLLAAIAAATLCPGCGHGRFPIQGEVTFDGKPVEEGTISLEPANGNGPTTGGKIVAGKYQLTGNAAPLPGKKIVRISAIRKTGRKVADNFKPAGATVDDVEPYIPAIYNSRSTLSCEVAGQTGNRLDFHLKSP